MHVHSETLEGLAESSRELKRTLEVAHGLEMEF